MTGKQVPGYKFHDPGPSLLEESPGYLLVYTFGIQKKRYD